MQVQSRLAGHRRSFAPNFDQVFIVPHLSDTPDVHLGAAVSSARFPVFLACACNSTSHVPCCAVPRLLPRRSRPLDPSLPAAPALQHFYYYSIHCVDLPLRRESSAPLHSTPRQITPNHAKLFGAGRISSGESRMMQPTMQNSAVPRLGDSLLWSQLTERGARAGLPQEQVAGPAAPTRRCTQASMAVKLPRLQTSSALAGRRSVQERNCLSRQSPSATAATAWALLNVVPN